MAEPLIAGLLCLIICLASGDDITLNKNAVRKSDLQIFIDTRTITNAVVLNKPDGSEEGRCSAPLSVNPVLCSANFAQNGTITTVTLSSVARANHQGVWTSIHGSDNGNINITVLTIPTLTVSQTVSALTLSSSNTQSLTIIATCAYPAVSLAVYFVPTGGGTAVSSPSSTATCTSTGNAGCTDTDANIYNCVIVPKVETSLSAGTYHVQFVVNLAGQYEPIGLTSTITDTVITTEASSSICDSCPTTIALAVIGLVVAVGCVAICWILYSQHSGKYF
ncbi:uncharacterized protein LOC110452212 [Mizuhopecten yessoensis]|uniref:uncharacterized protein LOC110452212 n=1 Tax=Mizuhopecten yessoensis TaxID=6573 RepID=UPI000B45CB5C|nr:uncharacterized protein LOC110452212 [Mizuhopecten yessoensis]